MPRTLCAAQLITENRHPDLDTLVDTERVDLLGCGVEQQINPLLIQFGLIRPQRAWIGRKVLIRSELGGVDEDAHHDPLGQFLSQFHQAEVTGVEAAHGGHKGHRLMSGAPAGNGLAYPGRCGDGTHDGGYEKQCSAAG